MEAKKPSGKNHINLILAVAFAAAWALFWAVDRTLAYILFGAASFFLVYFFYNRLLQRQDQGETRKPERGTTNGKDIRRKQEVVSSIEQGKIIARLIAILMVGSVVVFLFFQITSDDTYEMDEAVAYDQAERYYAVQQYDSAHYFYKQALKSDDEMAQAWLGLGNTLYMLSKYDSALLLYNKALSVDENYTQAKYNIAWWYYDQKQHRESIAKAKAMVVDDPSYLDAMQLAGDNFYSLNEYDSAMSWYEGAYTNGARSRWLCHVMAYLYDRNNVLDKAIPLYQEALQYDSGMVEIYVRLGELLPGEAGNVYRTKAVELKN